MYLLLLLICLTHHPIYSIFFFLNEPATTKFSPLPLHAPLPISLRAGDHPRHVERHQALAGERLGHIVVDDPLGDALHDRGLADAGVAEQDRVVLRAAREDLRSEEHTSELQSQSNIVCRLLLETK